MNSDPRGTFVFQTWRVSAPPHRPRGQISSSPLLCRDVSPRVTHPVWWTHTQTHTHIITHKHTLSLKPSAPPHPTTSLAFDYMSGDVYGPLFAVLMIIVTGWFHYQELSDGWVPTLTSTDTGVLDHWGRRNEQRSGGFMKGGSVRSRVVSFIYVSYSLKTCISVRRSGGWLEKWWGPDGAEIFLRFVGWQRQFMKSENETW